jgi:hypothetical protein
MCWTSLYTNKHKLISDVDVIPTLALHIVYHTKTISQISMYYAETREDNSGFSNHRVTCLVVMGSPFDSEQVC